MKARSLPSPIPWIFALLHGAVAGVATAAGLEVDTGQREAVRNVYNALYFASENVDMGWTGAVGSCTPGTTGAAYREATLLRVNLFRALAGVPAEVTLNEAFNAKAQQAALMMSANNTLSHFPPPTWTCFTPIGYEAAGKSNLSLGSAGPQAVLGYVGDRGDNNAAVGHRRWLFYPQTREMGTGDAAGDGGHLLANALWIADGRLGDPRPIPRNLDGSVTWPPSGYVPHSLVSPRWSLSYPKADFSAAQVGMSHDGANVPVTLEPIVGNVGENTLVWRPDDPALGDPVPAPGHDATFTVSVQGVKVDGQTLRFDYIVTLFDPAVYGGDTVLPVVDGSGVSRLGVNNPYAVQGLVPAADGFEWLSGRHGAYGAVQDAENGLGDLEADIAPTYSAVTDETAAGGARAYHLQDDRDRGQSLTLDKLLIPGPSGILSFDSRLGWAASSEVASVQISLDGGRSWQDLYSQRGTDSAGETGFTHRSLPLAGHRSRPLRVRFRLDIPDRRSFQFYNPGPGVGWYLDNIGFSDVSVVDAPVAAPAEAGGGFLFRPTAPDRYALAARGTVRGHPLEWGPARVVQVTADGAPNQAPVADAGPDLAVPAGTLVTLDGRNSSDPEGGSAVLTFAWRQTGGPPVALAGADTPRPSFTPTAPGSYAFSLTVSDGDLESPADTVVVSVAETGPLRLISPNGGETLQVKQRYEVRWESTGLAPKTKLKLQFSKNGVRWKALKAVKNKGRYVWKITRAQVGETVSLRLCGPNRLPADQRCDRTDGTFRVRR